MLENNGVVCAAAYDEKFEVKHILIENTGGGTAFQALEVPSMCKVI